jgi:bacillolysin
MPGPRCALVALTILGGALATVGAVPASARNLAQDLGPGVDVSRSDETGRVDFIATDPGSPIARPPDVAASDSATEAARAFLADHRGPVGLIRSAVDRTRVVDGPGEITAIRFQQTQAGVPVLGGEFIVNVDARNRIVSLSGEAEPATSAPDAPTVSPGDAIDTALTMMAKARDVERGELEVSDAALWIYDSRLLGGPGPDRPQLVWRTEVTNGAAGDIRELVLVDATTGGIALHFSEIAEGMNRAVCDANHTDSGLPCTSPVRSEGEGATGIGEVDDAYDFSGATYDFFLTVLGRDNLDGAGGPNPLKSTVRYCSPFSACPYKNAFWNGQQITLGDGYATDDIVGHEFTHGYTEFTSGLFYYYQSGAINESMSDVFGEFIDLHQNPTPEDTGGTRWLHGEEHPAGPTGTWRIRPPSASPTG